MSWLDGLTPEKEVLNQQQRLEFTSELPEPGAFHGAYDVIGPSLVRGGIEGFGAVEALAAQGSGNMAAMGLGVDVLMGGGMGASPIDDAEQEAIDRRVNIIGAETAQATIDLRPDPASTGLAGQIIGEAMAILPRTAIAAVAGGPIAGAVAAGAPAGFAGKYVGMAEGLDESTATLKGVIEGATVGVGAVLPAARFVKPVLGDLGIAIGANVGLGVGSRGATGALLENAGYTAQAAQYKAMDGNAIAVDAILGAAFFGIGRASMRAPSTKQVQAALAENNAQHFDVGTAPGLPATAKSAVAHQDALRSAVDQINRGEPVVLPDSIHSAEFLRAADEAAPIAPPRAEVLAAARTEIEPVIRAELEQQAAGIAPNVKDLKAELANLQRTAADLDATFTERAKAFQQQGQGRKKAETSARAEIAAERESLTQQQATINKTLESNRSGEQARADIAAIARGESPAGMDERIAARADEIAKGFEKKPLAAGVRQATDEGSFRTMAQVAREEIQRLLDDLDVRDPRPEAAPIDIAPVRADEAQAIAEPAPTAITESQPVAGTTTPASGKPGAVDPVNLVADEIMARTGDIQLPTGAIDAEGRAITVSAKQMLAEADADIARAEQDANGFAAAAACFLQRGVK